MPTQREHRSTQWTLDMANERWVLAKNATITVSNAHGIYEGTTGSEIVVEGDIAVSGLGYSGIRFMASNSTVNVGEDAFIDARQAQNGIQADGANQSIENHGRIEGGSCGVNFTLWGSLENHGMVRGYVGVAFTDGNAGSELKNFGKIEATHGVVFAPGAESTLVNGARGLIKAEESIAGGPNGQLDLVNTGKIIGDIKLGAMPNFVDSLNGKIFGEIYGGKSDDIYMISQSNLRIVEQAGWGRDEVRSSVSYRLPQELEVLVLAKNKNVGATGNAGDNKLYGNIGDNRINGLDGDDDLTGGRGRDILSGGLGEDVFHFAKGDRRDVITDFEDGVDRIALYSIQQQDDFDDLRIRQTGDDVLVDLGKGK
jgi:Ca2+-binding RTX toxin-like protein